MSDYCDNDDLLPIGLAKLLKTPVVSNHKPAPEEKVKEAFKKALENTTPMEAGTPWGKIKDKEELTEEAAKQRLLDSILGV